MAKAPTVLGKETSIYLFARMERKNSFLDAENEAQDNPCLELSLSFSSASKTL
jgi:hypothetical protein